MGGAEVEACASVAQTANATLRPIDVIFVIDNSSSMSEEILEVEQRIDRDFAKIIEASGLDYRVILVSRYGDVNVAVGQSDHPVCIGAPLGASDCERASSSPLRNAERFFQFSADVESHDAWCVLLGAFGKPDEFGDTPRAGWSSQAPTGYSAYLRPSAFKVFVVVSDDDADCKAAGVQLSDKSSVAGGKASAELFDQALLRLSREQFGEKTKRNYVWHSIVGLGAQPNPAAAWEPSAPVQTATCAGGSDGPGTGYQSLSQLTGGLRYPSCNHQNFDAIFNRIAQGIVDQAELACAWDIPTAPAGMQFDPARVNVRYTSGKRSRTLANVGAAAGCGGAAGWYYDDPAAPRQVVACPGTCDDIRADAQGRVDVLFGCATEAVVR